MCMFMDTHVWTHGAEPSCGPTRAWDRPSYGAAAKLGDGHLQTILYFIVYIQCCVGCAAVDDIVV